MSNTGLIFRPLDKMNSSEVGFVYKSWINSYKNHADVVPYSEYRATYQGYLERIIDRDNCAVILAVHPEHTDQIFGFVCYELTTPTLHYIYVKGGENSNYRREGVGSDLLEYMLGTNLQFSFTFNTALGRKFLKPRGGKYKPQIVRNELP